MTIKVEREALLRVLSRQPSSPSSYPCDQTPLSDDGEFVLVDLPKPFMVDEDSSCYVLQTSSNAYGDNDDRSLCTVSTDSLSTDSDDNSIDRRVTFSTTLVTDEWTRPWTPREEVADLFYSTEETQRFRHEYRLERKLLNELSVDPESFPIDNEQELSNIVATTSSCQHKQPSNRHLISRVVVLHKDRLETFLNPIAADEAFSLPKEEESVSGVGGESFDNDSFWSGSLTWY